MMVDYDIEYTNAGQIKIVFTVLDSNQDLAFFTIFLDKQDAWNIAKHINKLLRYKKKI